MHESGPPAGLAQWSREAFFHSTATRRGSNEPKQFPFEEDIIGGGRGGGGGDEARRGGERDCTKRRNQRKKGEQKTEKTKTEKTKKNKQTSSRRSLVQRVDRDRLRRRTEGTLQTGRM